MLRSSTRREEVEEEEYRTGHIKILTRRRQQTLLRYHNCVSYYHS
jgi:hypothetical protein